MEIYPYTNCNKTTPSTTHFSIHPYANTLNRLCNTIIPERTLPVHPGITYNIV